MSQGQSRVALSALAGAALVAALASPACSIRVGKNHAPQGDDGIPDGPSACARVGAETKLGFGAGAEAFAFVWDTDHYVVAYTDPSTGNGDIVVGKLAADGSPLGAPIPVAPTPAASDLPSLLKTQSGYLVAWEEGSAGKAVYAHALDAGANPTGSGATVASTQSTQPRPVLSRAPGAQAAVSWMDTFDGKSGVQVALVDPASLAVAGPQRIAQQDIVGWPWVAGDDRALAVVWSDKASGPYGIQFATLDPRSLAPVSALTLRAQEHNDALLPRVARTDYGFIAAWEDMRGGDNQIYMALVDSAGQTQLGGGVVEEPNSGDANWPNIAYNGRAAGIVYYQWRDSRPQIFLTFVDATGARVGGLTDLQVSSGAAGWSKYPDVVWTGSEFGVMYVDTRDGKPALWLQRVSCAG
jgi:hypothetical protein